MINLSRILDGPGGQARRAASGDGPDPAPTSSARPVSTTRAAEPCLPGECAAEQIFTMYEDAERRVGVALTELERVQHKCYRLKEEVKALRTSTSAQQAATARLEARRYKQALSNIAYRLESGNGFIGDETLRSIVSEALLLHGLRARDRRRIERAREQQVGSDAA